MNGICQYQNSSTSRRELVFTISLIFFPLKKQSKGTYTLRKCSAIAWRCSNPWKFLEESVQYFFEFCLFKYLFKIRTPIYHLSLAFFITIFRFQKTSKYAPIFERATQFLSNELKRHNIKKYKKLQKSFLKQKTPFPHKWSSVKTRCLRCWACKNHESFHSRCNDDDYKLENIDPKLWERGGKNIESNVKYWLWSDEGECTIWRRSENQVHIFYFMLRNTSGGQQ